MAIWGIPQPAYSSQGRNSGMRMPKSRTGKVLLFLFVPHRTTHQLCGKRWRDFLHAATVGAMEGKLTTPPRYGRTTEI